MAYTFGKETFEGGSPGAFDSVGNVWGSASASLDTSSKIAGVNSIRFDTTGEGSAGCLETLGGDVTELYIQFKCFFPSGTFFGVSGYTGFMTLFDNADDDRLTFNIEDYGTIKLTVNGDYGYATTVDIPQNQIVKVEIYVKKNATTGQIKIWLNNNTEGSPDYSTGNVNTSATAFRKIFLGATYAPEATADWWIDDVIFDTAFIGAGAPAFKIKTGTYTGNGSDNRAITGIGFQPTLVWTKPKDTTANNGAMSWDALGSDKSFDPAGSSTPSANMIQSFDVDGFTIGTEANVNTSGVDYVWVAMTGTSSYVKTGSYVGNGTSSKIVSGVGFQPDLIIIKRNGSSQGGYYWSLGNYRYTWTSNNGVSGVIIDNSDGFEVLSTSSVVNSNGTTYHYFCLKLDAAWGKMDSYTGNATDNNAKTGVGFSPDFVWIKSTSASKPAAFRTRDGHSGDSTTKWIASTADAADLIQSLDADGFTLGTSDVVNASTSYRYLALRSASSSASYNTTLTETVTLADTFIRNAMRVLSESVTYIDVVLKTASRTLSEVVTYIDSVQTNLTSLKTKVLSEVVTFTDTIIRTLTRVLSESVTYIATFNTAYNVVISNSVTYVDTVLKRAGKTIIEAFSPIDTLIRSLTRILSESVTYTDIFASIKMRVITITNSFTLSDTLTKLVLKVILAVENVQFIDTLKVYLNGVLGRWVKKFSSRGTSYNDKNAKRNTVYSDKYSKNNTDRWNNKYF